MLARIHVTLKNGVLDPQGKAIENTLQNMGFSGIDAARQGKYIELDLAETDRAKAEAHVDDMCRKLIANTVIENYSFTLE